MEYNGGTGGTALDHCHTSGEFRGWLCGSCNRGLGMFKDNPELLNRAADYLTKHRKTSKFWNYIKAIQD